MPRPTPEQLLRQVQAEELYDQCGKLKVFLGYASGVGKSFRMLDEGRRRRERGQDVVVGATQPRLSPELAELLAHLEVIPLRHEGGSPVMDLEAILRRRPQVCLVDGLAYDNPPGSRHAHRWQDVEELLDRGISVLSTVNLQYVEERREEVERIRGKRVNVTVPEKVLRRADEIVVVDAPADTCLECSGAGKLREIALLLAADVVDDQLEAHLERNGLAQTSGMQERLLVCLTPKAGAGRMIERAQLIRDRFHGELFAVYVGQSDLSADDQMALERHLSVARAAKAEIKLLQSEDPVAAIMQFAREHSITQIFIGHSLDDSWRTRFTRTFVDRLIRAAEGIDVKLFPIEHKGKLKIFLGYAAGVGKTYQMLEEAREQQLRGVDVVVGYFEPHARPDTIAKLDGLSVLPRREVEYRGTRFEEMDTGAILARHPQLCVVDEFPHTNVPGSERPKRWQDVLVLLEAGIDVYTTMNVQHLESLNDQVDKITGICVRETIPDWVVQQADDVVMVDLTPRALLNRLERGVVYQGEKAQQAKLNFFKESTLVALRELALRETAFEVEAAARPSVKSAERILVYITSGPSAQSLIRRGKRVADYLNGECLAVAFSIEEGPPAVREALDKNIRFARSLHIETQVLSGQDAAAGLVAFARERKATQLYLSRPPAPRWDLPFVHDLVQKVSRLARDMELTIVAERGPRTASVR